MNKNISDFIERLFDFRHQDSVIELMKLFYAFNLVASLGSNVLWFITFTYPWGMFRALIVLAVHTMIMYLIFKKTKWNISY